MNYIKTFCCKKIIFEILNKSALIGGLNGFRIIFNIIYLLYIENYSIATSENMQINY